MPYVKHLCLQHRRWPRHAGPPPPGSLPGSRACGRVCLVAEGVQRPPGVQPARVREGAPTRLAKDGAPVGRIRGGLGAHQIIVHIIAVDALIALPRALLAARGTLARAKAISCLPDHLGCSCSTLQPDPAHHDNAQFPLQPCWESLQEDGASCMHTLRSASSVVRSSLRPAGV